MLCALLFGLSAGHKAGLAIVAACFVVFALISAFFVPRRWPNFPGSGLRPFMAAAALFFVGMMLAVIFLAKEAGGEAAAGGKETTGESATEPATTSAGKPRSVTVAEVDYKIRLNTPTLVRGSYIFVLKNEGKDVHNLTISGPDVNNAATPTIAGGKTAKLQAALRPGTYELYCSVPGHKALGMDLKLRVT